MRFYSSLCVFGDLNLNVFPITSSALCILCRFCIYGAYFLFRGQQLYSILLSTQVGQHSVHCLHCNVWSLSPHSTDSCLLHHNMHRRSFDTLLHGKCVHWVPLTVGIKTAISVLIMCVYFVSPWLTDRFKLDRPSLPSHRAQLLELLKNIVSATNVRLFCLCVMFNLCFWESLWVLFFVPIEALKCLGRTVAGQATSLPPLKWWFEWLLSVCWVTLDMYSKRNE